MGGWSLPSVHFRAVIQTGADQRHEVFGIDCFTSCCCSLYRAARLTRGRCGRLANVGDIDARIGVLSAKNDGRTPPISPAPRYGGEGRKRWGRDTRAALSPTSTGCTMMRCCRRGENLGQSEEHM